MANVNAVPVPTAAQTQGYLDVLKNDPVVISSLIVGVVLGFALCYFLTRRGVIPTPDMTKEMKEMRAENKALEIKMARIEEKLEHSEADSKKWQALLNSFLADKKLDLLDEMALGHGKGGDD